MEAHIGLEVRPVFANEGVEFALRIKEFNEDFEEEWGRSGLGRRRAVFDLGELGVRFWEIWKELMVGEERACNYMVNTTRLRDFFWLSIDRILDKTKVQCLRARVPPSNIEMGWILWNALILSTNSWKIFIRTQKIPSKTRKIHVKTWEIPFKTLDFL